MPILIPATTFQKKKLVKSCLMITWSNIDAFLVRTKNPTYQKGTHIFVGRSSTKQQVLVFIGVNGGFRKSFGWHIWTSDFKKCSLFYCDWCIIISNPNCSLRNKLATWKSDGCNSDLHVQVTSEVLKTHSSNNMSWNQGNSLRAIDKKKPARR